ncbi:MAG: CBM96 family carbohydrate-binding protein [Nocardioides sp.]
MPMTPALTARGRRRAALLVATLLAVMAAAGGAVVLGGASEATTTVALGFVGDTGGNSNTRAVVAAARNGGVDAFFNLGDMSYNQVTPESSWCSLIKGSAGTMPYELLTGNHEDDGPDGIWSNFAACLPDTLGVTGAYARQYYLDYPAGAPVVRLIMLSPKMVFPEGSTYWSYKPGTQGYNFAANAVDGARSAGIPFVVVGMHMYCLSMVNYPCYANTDLMNMLVAKKVDVYLQAHDHAYARSKQLALNGSCTALSITAFNGACIADADPTSHYAAGAGTIIATAGQGGRSLNKQDPNKAVSAYFQTYMGSNNNPTYGFLRLDVTPTSLTGTFVRGSGGSYTDSFTITRSGTSPAPSSSAPAPSSSVPLPSSSVPAPSSSAPAPSSSVPAPSSSVPAPSSPGPSSVTLTPVADSWVGSDAASANHGTDKVLYADASPTKVTYLKFDLTALSGRTVTGAALQVTTASGAYSGSPDTERVRPVADSGWTETGVTYANRPAVGTAVLGSVSNTSGAGTTYTIPLDVSGVQPGVGQLLSLAVDTSGGDAFYIGSRESATPPRLVVTSQ